MDVHVVGRNGFCIVAEDCTILIDPILGAPSRRDGDAMTPARSATPNRLPPHDLLVLTRPDLGHVHVPSLARLSREVPVLIPKDPELRRHLEMLGYSHIEELGPFTMWKWGSARLLSTPLLREADGWGLVISDSGGTCWIHGNAAPDATSIRAVHDAFPSIDLLIATWRPSWRTIALSGSREGLVLREYARLLSNVALIAPRAVAPACSETPAPAPFLPWVDPGLRVNRESFYRDACLACASISSRALSLNIGDVALLRQEEPSCVIQRSPFAEPPTNPPDSEPAGSPVDSAGEHASPLARERLDHLIRVVTHLVEGPLSRFIVDNLTGSLAPHRDWGVVYRLSVSFPHTSRTWYFDLAGADRPGFCPTTQEGALTPANYFTGITAAALLGISDHTTEWEEIVGSGQYVSTDRCYKYRDCGMISPVPGELADPLMLLFPWDEVLAGVRERRIAETRAFWAEALLGRVRDAGGLPSALSLSAATDRPENVPALPAAPIVPVFITEEHNESFLIWHAAIRQGLMPDHDLALLHLDQHADMHIPRLRRPVPPLDADLAIVAEFAGADLDIDAFIVPACYQGLFKEIRWIQRDLPPSTRRFAVTAASGDEQRLELHEAPGGESEPPCAPRSWVTWHTTDLEKMSPLEGDIVLDIDLDYFSSDEGVNRQASLEITEREFLAFRADPYHPFRVDCRFEVRAEEGSYYLDFNRSYGPAVSPLRADAATVVARVEEFVQFLRSRKIVPLLINIARSRHSGFTPHDQFEFIEQHVVAGLLSLYDLRLSMPLPPGSGQEQASIAAPDGPDRPQTPGPTVETPSDRVAAASYLDFRGGRVLFVPTGCNNRCAFCMVSEFIEANDKASAPRGDAPVPPELAELVDSTPPGSKLDLFGAEPTLHPSFLNLLELALESDRQVSLATNARIFSSSTYTRKVAQLAKGRLKIRTTILGSDAEVHDRISGAPGSFEQMEHGIRNLLAKGIPVDINFVLTRENIHQSRKVAARAVGLGASVVKISGIIDLERNHSLFVPYEPAAEAVDHFCGVAEGAGVPCAIEKMPMCVSPRRMHQMVYEQAIYTPDRILVDGLGSPCPSCVVRNVCYGVEGAYLNRWGSMGLRTVSRIPEEVLSPIAGILEGTVQPPEYRVSFISMRNPGHTMDDWMRILEFKQRCEDRQGTLCIERFDV